MEIIWKITHLLGPLHEELLVVKKHLMHRRLGSLELIHLILLRWIVVVKVLYWCFFAWLFILFMISQIPMLYLRSKLSFL